MALPFLALYLTRRLHFSEPQAGVVLGCYGLGALVVSPIAGGLCDRIGPLPMMRFSLGLSGSLLLLFPFVNGYSSILILTILWAAAAESFRPANLSLLTSLVTPAQRKPAFALVRLAINLGMSIGPAVGGFLVLSSYSLLFWVDGATSILAGIFLSLPSVFGHMPLHGANLMRKQNDSAYRDGRLLFGLLAMLPVSIVFFQHQSTLPLFLGGELGFSPVVYGLMLPVNTILILVFEVPMNVAMSHWTHRRSLVTGALLIGAGFGVLAVTRGPVMAALSVAIWSFGEIIFLPAAVAYVADITPVGASGQYMGAYQMMFSLTLILSPMVGTAVLHRYGSTVLWIGALAVALASAALLARIPSARAA